MIHGETKIKYTHHLNYKCDTVDVM